MKKQAIEQAVRGLFRKLGYDIVRFQQLDFTEEEHEIIRAVKPYTMTSTESVYALIQAVKYVVRHGIQGDIVECGTWKGGSVMAVARTLMQLDRMDRDLWLFDTFEGMTAPGTTDVTLRGEAAVETFQQRRSSESSSDWCMAPIDEVRRAVFSTGYDRERIHFVKGRVEETIPAHAPQRIALLRMDTDWYESTRHEFEHLYPRLSSGGVLILDDYGYWLGVKKAADEYFERNDVKILLNRIDYSARIGIKT
jgi:hypothetical protein